MVCWSAEAKRVFDILLDGSLLRGTLEQVLLEKGQSTEATVDVEYTFLVVPPQQSSSIPQQAWCGRICAGAISADHC